MTLQDIDVILALLAEQFPGCFTTEWHLPHRPLKIGIDRDLAERCPALDRRERGAVMRCYTSRLMYLQSLVEGAVRIDLDGSPAGEVTAKEAEFAAARFAGILAARAAKRVAAKAVQAQGSTVQPPVT